jgi:hypothetical protein
MFHLFHSALFQRRISAPVPDLPNLQAAPAVRASGHPEGVVLIHTARGIVFTSNRVGAMIWTGIAQRSTLDGLTASISREFQVPADTARKDTLEFLDQLEAAGLVVRCDN